jgi:hypothetical protein
VYDAPAAAVTRGGAGNENRARTYKSRAMDHVWRALQEDLARERGPMAWLRSRSRTVRMLLVGALGVLDAWFFHTFMERADMATFPVVRLVLMLSACSFLIFVGAWHALRPLHRAPVPAWVARVLVGATLVLPVVFAVLPEVPTAPPAAYAAVAYDWWCLSTGLAQGAALLLLVRVLDRRGRRADMGTLLAAASGAMLGMVGLIVYCPINYPSHLLTGHAAMPLAMLAGVWLWRRAAR